MSESDRGGEEMCSELMIQGGGRWNEEGGQVVILRTEWARLRQGWEHDTGGWEWGWLSNKDIYVADDGWWNRWEREPVSTKKKKNPIQFFAISFFSNESERYAMKKSEEERCNF